MHIMTVRILTALAIVAGVAAAEAVGQEAPIRVEPAAVKLLHPLRPQSLLVLSAAADGISLDVTPQATIVSNGPTYQTASGRIGGSPTIMAGYDQNSSGGTQNGVSWNQVLATANLLVSAYNAINMMRVSQASQAARGMSFTSFPSGSRLLPGNAICGAGYRGGGTANSPCIQALSQFCQSLLDGGCVERRVADSLGNVVVYLERASSH